MIITEMVSKLIEIPLPKPVRYAWVPGSNINKLNFTLIEIYTDEGIIGVGASHSCVSSEIAVSTQSLIKPFLIGKDPFAVEKHIQTLHSANPFGTRPWLVDQALWDIVGKACQQPIYRLWGAYQDKIIAYVAPPEQISPEETAESAIQLKEKGVKAIKLRLHNEKINDDLRVVQTVLDKVGDEMNIMVDANQALLLNSQKPHPIWDYSRAFTMANELEKMGVYYLEEPLPIRDFEEISRLTKDTKIRIAGGEWNIGIQEFKIMLDMGCYDIIQPDATQSEGLFQMRKIAALAETHNKLFIPHTWGNGIGLAANFQVALSVPNCPFFEYPYDEKLFNIDIFQGMIKNPLIIDKDGYLPASEKPGLGVELNYDFIEKYTTCVIK